MTAHGITPCLWFDTQAEEAAKFYASVFKDAKIGKTSRYGNEGVEVHGKQPGTVMTVAFEIAGQKSGAQRRPALQVQRSGLVRSALRLAGGH